MPSALRAVIAARAEAVWDEAVTIERAKQRFDRTGQDKRRFKQTKVDEAWQQAVEMFEQVSREEDAWKRACAALGVFRPDGQLNDRTWAETELQQAASELRAPVLMNIPSPLRVSTSPSSTSSWYAFRTVRGLSR